MSRPSRSSKPVVFNTQHEGRITNDAFRLSDNAHYASDNTRVGIAYTRSLPKRRNDQYENQPHANEWDYGDQFDDNDNYGNHAEVDEDGGEEVDEEQEAAAEQETEEAAEEDHDGGGQSEEELLSEEEDDVNEIMNVFEGIQNDQRLNFIKNMFSANQKKQAEENPKDGETPCMPSDDPILAKKIKTKAELAKGISIVKAEHGITNTGMTAVCSVIHDCAPGLLLPIKVVEKSGVVQLKLEDYVGKDWRSIKVDVCPVGCTVYTGVNAKKIRCEQGKCKMMRYSPCYYKSHKGGVKSKGAIFCNPADGIHGVNHRAVNSNYYYRPIIPLFQELIEWCIENNVDLFSFEKTRYQKDGELHDVFDAPQAQENLKAMQMSFEEKAKNTPGLRQFSFLLSEFYDGGTLFKRNSISVWPLIMSILNLTPSERLSYGIGLFLVALHCLKPGSVAEESLFDELFVKELQCLY